MQRDCCLGSTCRQTIFTSKFLPFQVLWVILSLLLYEGLSRAGVVATVVSLLGVVQARVVMSLEVHLEGKEDFRLDAD